jgi:hypothetical protein
MGNFAGRNRAIEQQDLLVANPANEEAANNVEDVRGLKRGASSELNICNEEDSEFDKLMHTPKKKKLRTTSRYI